MPHKHTIRTYAAGYPYHIYNRGVDKRTIFLEEPDYVTFLGILKYYLSPLKQGTQLITSTPYWRVPLQDNEVELFSFCLMPNHFHLLLKQNSSTGITRIMRRTTNAYVSFFNRKYQRVGPLFQGKFKSSLVDSDAYLLHLSRYIHRNPLDLEGVGPLHIYPYSTYAYYLGLKNASWIKPAVILAFFQSSEKPLSLKQINTYQSFVEEYEETDPLPENLTLE